MNDDYIERIIITREQIAARVDELSLEITMAFQGEDITIVPVLTGSIPFASDLMRRMSVRMRVEPVSVSSYPGKSTRSKGCQFRLPPTDLLKEMNVLIVDDIFDSGNTMKFLIEEITSIGAACIKSCVLLRKSRPDLPDRENLVDYVGFDIPDQFVIGYGLDYNELYRNLPDIGVLSGKARSE